MITPFFEKIDGWSAYGDQGALLDVILRRTEGKECIRVAEIGVYKGRMTAMWNVMLYNWTLLHAPMRYEYDAIDHFEGSAEHAKDVDYYGLTLQNLEPLMAVLPTTSNKLEVIKNESLRQCATYPDDFFDIVYIDASHEYESVLADIRAWYPKVKAGGYICGDDYTPGWPGVVQAVNSVFENRIETVGSQQWLVLKH